MDQVKKESQVVVHCAYTGNMYSDKMGIWASTFLYFKRSSHKNVLIHMENITVYPMWLDVANGQTMNFVMIFSELQKHYRQFDIIENKLEPGGFVFKDIDRNKSDVYSLEIK